MFRYFILVLISLLSFSLGEEAICSQLNMDFSQDNRTYIWNTRLDCNRKADFGLSWRFSSYINSMLIKKSIFSNNQNRWQEDGRINMNLAYTLTKRLGVGALFSQEISSLEKRKVTGSTYGITSEYVVSGVKLVQAVGGKNINRRWEDGKRNDAGLNHRLEISHSPHVFSDSRSSIWLSQTFANLSNVPTLERDFNVFFAKTFPRKIA